MKGQTGYLGGRLLVEGFELLVDPFVNLFKKIRISYKTTHTMQQRATPDMMMKRKLPIQLYKLYNSENENDDWVDLHFQQNFNERNPRVQIIDCSRIRVGKNILNNKLSVISNQIEYDWLNLSHLTFKLRSKELFLNKTSTWKS